MTVSHDILALLVLVWAFFLLVVVPVWMWWQDRPKRY